MTRLPGHGVTTFRPQRDPQMRKQPRRDHLSTYQKAAGFPAAALRDEQQPTLGGPGDGCSSRRDATGEQRRYPPRPTVKRARIHAPRPYGWLQPVATAEARSGWQPAGCHLGSASSAEEETASMGFTPSMSMGSAIGGSGSTTRVEERSAARPPQQTLQGPCSQLNHAA